MTVMIVVMRLGLKNAFRVTINKPVTMDASVELIEMIDTSQKKPHPHSSLRQTSYQFCV